MDVSLFANIFLFLGALGLNVGLSSDANGTDSGHDEDPLYHSDGYLHVNDGTAAADQMTATGDNQAWFLHEGNDDLTASSGADYANLGAGDDHAAMGAGNDIALGAAGNDSLDGGVGADSLFGGAGNDQMQGGLGDDGLAGGDGNDDLWGSNGADILTGGLGDDTISGFTQGQSGAAGMTGTEGSDQLFGGDGNDMLTLGHGDIATGGSGNDIFDLDTRWSDGAGIAHIADFDQMHDQLQLHYTPHYSANTSEEVPPTLTLIETADGNTEIRMDGALVAQLDGVTGLSLSDIALHPDTQTDPSYVPGHYSAELHGTAAGDSLTGSSGNDYADLGAGNDHASLGDGNDSVLGQSGDDSIDGGLGADSLRGGDGADALHGDAGDDRMAGDKGDDLMAGGAGADSLLGGAGNDTLSGYSDTHSSDPSLTSIDGADTLLGGDGNDTLILGHGDAASGGDGADHFELEAQYADGTAGAVITDYQSGTDHIQLHYKPHFDGTGTEIAPVIAVHLTTDGSSSVIMMDGVLVATINGSTTLTVADVALVREA